MIDATPTYGVKRRPNKWRNYKTEVALIVNGTKGGQTTNTVDFALSKEGSPYTIWTTKWSESEYYCSKLVWQAWKKQGFDLDSNIGGTRVTDKVLLNQFVLASRNTYV